MGFRIQLDETFEAAFRRISKEQIAKAHRHLAFNNDPALAILATRKCMKRLRTFMRLYRSALGKSDFASENARYRDINRLLSQTRDHHVIAETIAQLIDDLDTGPKPRKAKTLRKGLAAVLACAAQDTTHTVKDAGRQGARAFNTNDAFDAVRRIDNLRALEALKRRAIASLDEAQQEIGFLHLKGHGFKIVGRGLEKGHRQCVEMFLAANRNDDDEALHDWRKSVQILWRQLQLFQDAWPEYFATRATALKSVSRQLGRHSDLCLVKEFIAAQPASDLNPKLARSVGKHIQKQKNTLRAKSLDAALVVLADDPKHLTSQVARYWKAAKQQKFKGKSNGDNTTKPMDRTPEHTKTGTPFKLPDRPT